MICFLPGQSHVHTSFFDADDDDDCRLVERSVYSCISHAHDAVRLSQRHNRKKKKPK